MKVLLVTLYFPPAGGGGVQRSLKLAQYLPALGIETHVLAPDDPKWIHRDAELRVPTQAWVHRAAVRRAEGAASGRGAPRHDRARAGRHTGADRDQASARPRRERDVEPDRDPGRDQDRPPREHRRCDHDVAAGLDPLRRRGGQAGNRRGVARGRARRARRESAPSRGHDGHQGQAGGKRPARAPRRTLCGRDLGRLGRDRRRAARARPARGRPHDRERRRLRRLRRPRVPARGPLPDHAHGQLLREARPAPVPPGARGLEARRGRALRRRLPRLRSRVGRRARARRPARADPVLAESGVASPPARLRGAAAPRPGRGRAREGRPQREGVRVPGGGAADPGRRAARRCSRET